MSPSTGTSTGTSTGLKGVQVTLATLASEDQTREWSRESHRLYRRSSRETKLARKRRA